VVDDDEAVRDSLDAVLTAWGYQTNLYDSGNAFLAGLDGIDGACVLMDLHMPGLDGIETARALNAKSRHFHVILMSALFDDTARQAAGEAGVDALIEKPFTDQTLLDALSPTPNAT
jgi:two-component system response regulator FixJ